MYRPSTRWTGRTRIGAARPAQTYLGTFRATSFHIALCLPHSGSTAIGQRSRSVTGSRPSTTRGIPRNASWMSGARVVGVGGDGSCDLSVGSGAFRRDGTMELDG